MSARNSLQDENVSISLQNALNEVEAVDAMLDQYETSKDKKILAKVTENMKVIAAQLRELSANPACKTKENAPMLQQLSGKMKNLVKRTKLLANTPPPSEDPNATALPQARSRTTSYTNLNDTGAPTIARTMSTSVIDQKPKPLKGWLKKQGEDMLKAWKTRYFAQNGTELHYFHTENDPKSLGSINMNNVSDIIEVNKTQFDLVTGGRVYHLSTVPKTAADEKSEFDYWVNGIRTWMKYVKDEEERKTQKEQEAVLQAKLMREKERQEREHREEAERKHKEEQERIVREETERKIREEREKEEQIQREKEEQERKIKEQEQQERLKQEEEERKLKEEKEKEEHERQIKEEMERVQKLQREENEKRQLAESLQRRQELEAEATKRKQELEAQRKLKEDQERKAREEHEAQALEHQKQQQDQQKQQEQEKQKQQEQHEHSKLREQPQQSNALPQQPEQVSQPQPKTQEQHVSLPNKDQAELGSQNEPPKDLPKTSAEPVKPQPVATVSNMSTVQVSHNLNLPENLMGKDKDEIIKILLDKLKSADTNHELFLRLEEELKQKEKQYEILRGKQKLDQEGKKLAEEKLELLKQEIKKKDEEMAAKDKHIRQLTKKLKQARKDWITNDYNPNESTSVTQQQVATSPNVVNSPSGSKSWQLNPEIDLKNREIKQLKEAIWAHQNQNASLAQEVERLENEHRVNLKVKEDNIRGLEKELTFVKQTHQALREKYLSQQLGLLDPQDKSLLAELQKLRKDCKLNMRQECNITSSSLYERAIAENVEWPDWSEWIPAAMTGTQFIKRASHHRM